MRVGGGNGDAAGRHAGAIESGWRERNPETLRWITSARNSTSSATTRWLQSGGVMAAKGRIGARYWLLFAAVVIAIAALTLHRLGAADVCGANEAVEGVFLQQMVEHGAILFPLENGRAPMYKPPLFHWTATALDRLAGIDRVTAFNLRLPSALYAIGGVILTIGFATSFLGASGGALAGLLLAASYQYVSQGRIGRVDMTLCFFETLALFVFMWWYAPRAAAQRRGEPARGSEGANLQTETRGDVWMRYALAAALGLGVLAKGPVGALIPGLAIAVFLVVEKRLRELRRLITPGPLILGLALASSWYLACFMARRYGFLDRQLESENFGRFFGTLGSMKPWYYVMPILLNSAPFSLFVPIAIFAAIRTYWRPGPLLFARGSGERPRKDFSLKEEKNSSFRVDPSTPLRFARDDRRGRHDAPADASGQAHTMWRAHAAARLLAIFWIVTVVFFTLAAYKRRAYLLPLWPASAVVLAWWLQALTHQRWGRVLRGAAVGVAATLIVGFFLYLPSREIRACGNDSFRVPAGQINRVVGRDEPLYLYGLFDEPAPLLFYLDREAPRIGGKLGDAPPGYVIVPVPVWRRRKEQALDLTPVYRSAVGKPPVVLLRHGPAYASGR
ncbi:MAG: ArnT family glycosyltransferase [Candidatus Binataceae bacterium]